MCVCMCVCMYVCMYVCTPIEVWDLVWCFISELSREAAKAQLEIEQD